MISHGKKIANIYKQVAFLDRGVTINPVMQKKYLLEQGKEECSKVFA